MRQRRGLARTLITAAAGAACLAIAMPAWADPPGANGTVKIDAVKFDDDPSNEPHVGCTFQVKFFGFDQDETADLIFEAWPPSGDFVEVLALENEVVSDDAAGGSMDDDRVFTFTADQLDLKDSYLHPQQGYHVKLTIKRHGNPPWTEKHKVFWLPPCPSDEPSTPPGDEESPKPSGPADSPAPGGGSLPITGAAVGTIALAGVALIGGGAALMVIRRRRDITFIS